MIFTKNNFLQGFFLFLVLFICCCSDSPPPESVVKPKNGMLKITDLVGRWVSDEKLTEAAVNNPKNKCNILQKTAGNSFSEEWIKIRQDGSFVDSYEKEGTLRTVIFADGWTKTVMTITKQGSVESDPYAVSTSYKLQDGNLIEKNEGDYITAYRRIK